MYEEETVLNLLNSSNRNDNSQLNTFDFLNSSIDTRGVVHNNVDERDESAGKPSAAQLTSNNIETIRSCLGVMVDETTNIVAFWDSLHFLHSYKSLSIEYLERIIKRELDR